MRWLSVVDSRHVVSPTNAKGHDVRINERSAWEETHRPGVDADVVTTV
jgi:hypothetical protein